jgi:hypothetical protein
MRLAHEIRAAHGAKRSKRLVWPLTPLRFVRGSDEIIALPPTSNADLLFA